MSFSIHLIRHENRFNCAISDCSLTTDGLYSSQYELPDKLDQSIKTGRSDPNDPIKIYCSPTLRTLQTIWFYAKNHNIKIRVDQLIYESIANRIEHYYGKSIPVTTDYNVYGHGLQLLDRAYGMCPNSDGALGLDDIDGSSDILDTNELVYDLKETKFLLQCAQFVLNSDVHTYRTKNQAHPDIMINRVINSVTEALTSTDCTIYALDEEEYSNESQVIDDLDNICCFITNAMDALKEYNFDKYVDHTYDSGFSIASHIESYRRDHPEATHETIDCLVMRIDTLVQNIMHDPEYQNAAYVSHASPIASIITCMYRYIYGESWLEVVCRDMNIRASNIEECIHALDVATKVGSVLRIDVDTKNNTIEIANF